MVFNHLIFYCFIILCIWLVPKFSFVKNTDLKENETRLLLCFKMLASLGVAYYFSLSPNKFDSVTFNVEGKLQYQLLLSNPALFFTDFINDGKALGLGRLFETDSFWGYLRFILLFKFLAILNLVTKGNFFYNTIIFSIVIFFGHISFYKIYSNIFKGNKLKLILTCFFLPSLLFYTSCVHKDGMIFTSLGLVSYIFYTYLNKPQRINTKWILLFFIGMTTIFLFRNYVLVAMVPAMLIALLCNHFTYKKIWIIIVSYSSFVTLFFLSGFLNSFLNIPAAIIKRKAEFASSAEGNTNLLMNELLPSFKSFVLNLPQAFDHFFFRPYLWEFKNPAILLTALELFFYQLIILLLIFCRKKHLIITNNFNVFGVILFVNMILIIGYTIPNIGAIVRYRSVFWIFILCPMICMINFKKINLLKKQTA